MLFLFVNSDQVIECQMVNTFTVIITVRSCQITFSAHWGVFKNETSFMLFLPCSEPLVADALSSEPSDWCNTCTSVMLDEIESESEIQNICYLVITKRMYVMFLYIISRESALILLTQINNVKIFDFCGNKFMLWSSPQIKIVARN